MREGRKGREPALPIFYARTEKRERPSTFFTHHLRLHRRRTPQQIAPQRLWIGAHYRFYIRFDNVPGAQPDLALELRSAPACVAEEETLDAVRLLPEEAPKQRAVRAEVHIADHWDGTLCVRSPAKQEHQPAGLHRAAEEERISPLLELRLVREPFLQGELRGPVQNYTDRTTVFREDDEHDALRKIGVLQLRLRDEKDRRRHGLGSTTGHPTEQQRRAQQQDATAHNEIHNSHRRVPQRRASLGVIVSRRAGRVSPSCTPPLYRPPCHANDAERLRRATTET